MVKYITAVLPILLYACNSSSGKVDEKNIQPTDYASVPTMVTKYDSGITTIHLFVALCDNKYQGIVPVPAAIGNGQDKDNNLYWGCGYGAKTFFRNSAQWTLVDHYPVNDLILERSIFKSRQHNAYLIADAYDGRYIQQCTINLLNSCAGRIKNTIKVGQHTLGINSNGTMLAYIGHDGLMDFSLPDTFKSIDDVKRKGIVLACASRNYFGKYLQAAKADPLLWTTNLMCPEAYTLHDALESFLKNETTENIRIAAAGAYSKYQKCSIKAAKGLLVTGWK